MRKIAEIATALKCDPRDLITPVKENAQGKLMPPLWIMSAALVGEGVKQFAANNLQCYAVVAR